MFKPTKYKLVNVGTGRVFEDEGSPIRKHNLRLL